MDLDSLSILLFCESKNIDFLISQIKENPIYEILFVLIIIAIFGIILIIILNNQDEKMKQKKRLRISYQSHHNKGAYKKNVAYTTTRTSPNDQDDVGENNEQANNREESDISRDVNNTESNNASESFSDESKDSPKEIESIKKSSQKDVIQSFIMLTVKNGLFAEADSNGVYYYKTWTAKGKKLFEFVNNDRTLKAINNRSILIEPFCIKMEKSISPDEAAMIETIEPGILSDDYTVEEKAKIIYK